MESFNFIQPGNFILTLLVWCLIGYLVGSIPVAWLVTHWTSGGDLRQMGSGNLGVMNTAISSSRHAGILVFLAEAAKGALAVYLPGRYAHGDFAVGLCLAASVLGTRNSIWMGFRGGRGNTAGMAALALVSWHSLAVLLGTWIVARRFERSSFLATRLVLSMMPVAVYTTTQSWWWSTVALILCLMYLSTQHENTDDNLIMQAKWRSFWAYFFSPLFVFGKEKT